MTVAQGPQLRAFVDQGVQSIPGKDADGGSNEDLLEVLVHVPICP